MIPYMGSGSPSMFAREEEHSTNQCTGIYHDENFGNPRRGLDLYAGFCSIDCREDYFSSLGAGDIRNDVDLSITEITYIRGLPAPA